MKKRTKALQFDKKTMYKIAARDHYSCYFCMIGYHTKPGYVFERNTYDIMHVIPKSQGGLGIEENGMLGCRYHHQLLDNGNKGVREEMLEMIEEYMKCKYPNWDRGNLFYKKGIGF